MTSIQAKELALWYRNTILRGLIPNLNVQYLRDFVERMQQLPNEKEAKIMRWLGFVQGALWTAEVYTTDELKEHSKRAVEGWSPL